MSDTTNASRDARRLLTAETLRHRVGRSDRADRIGGWQEITCTPEDLLGAMAVLGREHLERGTIDRLTPAAELVIQRGGLDHWLLWGVEETLGRGATGFGALVGTEEVQLAATLDGRHSLQCSCAWWRRHHAAGRPCEHLLALELTIEACCQARRRRASAPAGSSRQQRRAAAQRRQ